LHAAILGNSLISLYDRSVVHPMATFLNRNEPDRSAEGGAVALAAMGFKRLG
jgi:hypothetical protein